jgi:hypothetical protein
VLYEKIMVKSAKDRPQLQIVANMLLNMFDTRTYSDFEDDSDFEMTEEVWTALKRNNDAGCRVQQYQGLLADVVARYLLYSQGRSPTTFQHSVA